MQDKYEILKTKLFESKGERSILALVRISCSNDNTYYRILQYKNGFVVFESPRYIKLDKAQNLYEELLCDATEKNNYTCKKTPTISRCR